MWGEPISVVLPYEQKEGRNAREVISSIVNLCWDALNDWTAALNIGTSSLKIAVAILASKSGKDYPPNLHEETIKLNSSVLTMEKVVNTLKEAKDQLRKIMELEDKKSPGKSDEPLFITMPLFAFAEIINQILEGYEKETAVKQSALNPLTRTHNQDTLNHCITMWTTHSYLPQPHMYHIKMLLKETKQI